MKINKNSSTLMQAAYARRVWGGEGKNRKEIALDVGYSKTVANNTRRKIENTMGFHNELLRLAKDSNMLALAAMEEFKARGFYGFTNKELINGLKAISSAWAIFNKKEEPNKGEKQNLLRTVILKEVENEMVENKEVERVNRTDYKVSKGYYDEPQKGEEEEIPGVDYDF